MKKQLTLAVFGFLLSLITANAQAPTCQSNVPFWQVNLTGQPQGTVYIPLHSRQGDCCTDNNCTSIEVTLDTGAAMIEMGFDLVNHPNQAIPSGSLRYQVNCGPQTLPGVPICISGVGPHYVTFCKPGNNPNAYYIRSIAKPTFPKPDSVRVGCSKPLVLLGLVDQIGNRPTWNSIFPGPAGAFNSWLNTTQGDTVIYTPQNSSVPFVDYLVCGNPIATICGYVAVCDTVRVYNFQQLIPSAFPQVGQFCVGGPGVTFTGSATGGITPYSFIWRNSSLSTVSTTNTFSTNVGGSYSLEIRDILYDATYCPSTPIPVTAIAVPPPVVNAGPDQTLCVGSTAVLNGSVSNAVSGQWTGGAGTFTPNDTSLLAGYTPTPLEYASGQVTLTLTSRFPGAGCSNVADQITLFFPPAPQVAVSDVQVNCFGSTTTLGSITSGGAGQLTFNWSNGATTSSITAGEGTYCLTVIDTLGCTATDCGNITEPSPLTITMSSTDVTVNGGNDGTATTIVNGGTGPYSYNWSPGNPTGDGTASISGLVFGIYTVVATDANGCTINSSVVVNEPRCNTFQASATSTNVNCFGGENGAAAAIVNSGVGPFSFQWNSNPIQNTAIATNLPAGVYQVTVTDLSNGCVDIVNVTITQPTQLSATTTQTNVTAIGGNNGSATVNPFDGTAPYTFLWSNGQTTQTINNLVAGTYSVTVTDFNGCTTTNTVIINQPPCNNLTAAVYPNAVTCNGGSDGSASVTVLFANNPLTYLWSNGATTSSISNVPAGVYSVTVTDALNCQAFVQFTITEPSPLSVNAAASNITCFGYQNGTLELFVSGGTFPYTYAWSNGLAVQDQINVGAGNYTVIVTDANGCTASTSAIITEPSLLVATPSITNALCNGDNNGIIDLQVSGGNGGYTYLWSNGQTTQDLSNLTSGLYTVTITDLNGCTESSPFTYYVPEPPVVTATATVDCPIPGSGQALVQVTPDGGNSIVNYQISYDNGSTFQPVGSYSILLPTDSAYQIQVTDSLGCTLPLSLPIDIDPEVEILSINFNPCVADNVTSIPVTVNVTGGNGGPISISTNGGVTYLAPGVNTVNLATGNTYIIIARDSTNCISLTDTIFIPNEIVLSGTVPSFVGGVNVTCFGANDGSIDLSAIGGFGTYTYAWSNSASTQDVTNLTAGTYSVIVTDANACADTIAFTLSEPAVLASSVVSTGSFNGFDVPCNGDSLGGINLTVTGGTTSYTYAWSNSAATEDISTLPAGTYSVTITDANSCTTTQSITLTEPTSLSIAANVTPILCANDSTGAINITTTGGVTNYSFVWSNGDVTEDLSNVPAGIYQLTVTDANNCVATFIDTLVQPTVLSVTGAVTNLTCYEAGNGSIDVTTGGGTTPYNFNWSNNATTEDVTSLEAGTYNVIVTDFNGCDDTLTFTVTRPDSLMAQSTVLTNFNGYSIDCFGNANGSVDLTITGGTQGYTYLWSNGAVTEDISALEAGVYTVLITDTNLCTVTDTVTITQPDSLFITATPVSILCNGAATGSIDIEVTGGVPGFDYIWTNGDTIQEIANLAAGTYQVTMTDSNGCVVVESYTLTQPTPVVVADSVTNLLCFQDSTGSINLNTSGGVAPYTYGWSNGAITEDVDSISAGNYQVIVTDANNCVDTLSYVVTEPTVLTGTIASTTDFNGFDVSCAGSTNGGIDVQINGGTTGYTYVWNTGDVSEDLTNIGAGIYTVTATDANGCLFDTTITLTEPPVLVLNENHVNVPCNGFTTGSIDLTINGGVTPYTYLWSNNATTQDIDTLGAGTYNVVATDANGCTIDSSITITENSPIVAVTSSTNLLCFGDANGSIQMTITGATPPYTILWSNGSNVEDQTGLAAGIYSVLVTDSNNCAFADTFIVAEPPQLGMSSSALVYTNGYNVSAYQATDGSIDVTATGGTAPLTYSWSNGQNTEDLNGIGAGTYIVTVTDANGCTTSDSVTLREPVGIDMPTGFSPNMDGKNDAFVIEGLDAFKDNKLEIYNRWGNLVYDAVNYNNQWRGTSNTGENLPDGTYFVILNVNDGQIILTGFVDLRRQ